MALTYRTAGPWGPGGPKLTKVQFDTNTWELHSRIAVLEAISVSVNNIVNIEISGSTLNFIFQDYTTIPIELPDPELPFAGTWLPETFYDEGKWISAPGGLYEVLIAHTSAEEFDPNATEGGNPVYSVILSVPNNLPTGGSPGSILRKADYADYVTLWQTFEDFMVDVQAEISFPTIDFTDLTGTIDPDTQLPVATDTQIGGVQRADSVAKQWMKEHDADGVPVLAQPTSEDLDWNDASFPFTTGTNTWDPGTATAWLLTPTGDMTINVSSVLPGKPVWLIITTSGTTPRTLTFGTNTKTTGTLNTGSVSAKKFIVHFYWDSLTLYEVSRTTAM